MEKIGVSCSSHPGEPGSRSRSSWLRGFRVGLTNPDGRSRRLHKYGATRKIDRNPARMSARSAAVTPRYMMGWGTSSLALPIEGGAVQRPTIRPAEGWITAFWVSEWSPGDENRLFVAADRWNPFPASGLRGGIIGDGAAPRPETVAKADDWPAGPRFLHPKAWSTVCRADAPAPPAFPERSGRQIRIGFLPQMRNMMETKQITQIAARYTLRPTVMRPQRGARQGRFMAVLDPTDKDQT